MWKLLNYRWSLTVSPPLYRNYSLHPSFIVVRTKLLGLICTSWLVLTTIKCGWREYLFCYAMSRGFMSWFQLLCKWLSGASVQAADRCRWTGIRRQQCFTLVTPHESKQFFKEPPVSTSSSNVLATNQKHDCSFLRKPPPPSDCRRNSTSFAHHPWLPCPPPRPMQNPDDGSPAVAVFPPPDGPPSVAFLPPHDGPPAAAFVPPLNGPPAVLLYPADGPSTGSLLPPPMDEIRTPRKKNRVMQAGLFYGFPFFIWILYRNFRLWLYFNII